MTDEPQFPLVQIHEAGLNIQTAPSGEKVLFIGPLVLALPLDDENARAVAAELTGGLVLASAADLPKAAA